MHRSLIIPFLLISFLDGRENPFFDLSTQKKVTSNIPDYTPSLGSVHYDLPNQSRVLKEVSFTFQNVDGSIETRKMQIDKAVDWHKTIMITQGSSSAPKSESVKGEKSADFGFIHFNTSGKHLSIKTSDTIMRHFVLSEPNRIVIDFNHTGTFKAQQKALSGSPYNTVAIGYHGKFLRTTITLDGRYEYVLNRSGNIINIICK